MNHSPLLDLSVAEFLDRLASSAPAPGGGAAAALAGAMGAALIQMTANLTLNRPRLADVHPRARQIESDAGDLRRRLETLAAADAAAYARVAAAYRMPREGDAQRAERDAAIQASLVEAAEVPLEVAQACAAILQLAEAAAPDLNAAVISDVLVGALLAHAALEASAANVEVNVGSMRDEATVIRLNEALERARGGAREQLERTTATARSRFPGHDG